MTTELMNSEEKHPKKMQFAHSTDANNFLLALTEINPNLAKKLKKDTEDDFDDLIDFKTQLICNNKYNISHIMGTYETVRDGYINLYDNGTTEALINLLNKCGSLEYIFDLLDDYLYKMEIESNQTVDDIDKEFLNKICNDPEFYNEFHVFHLGLFNMIRMVLYPNVGSPIKFKKMSVRPLSQGDVLIGLKLVFPYNTVMSDDIYCIEFELDFPKLRRCVVSQSVQCMSRTYNSARNWTNCEFKTDNEYRCYNTLAHLAAVKGQN